MEIEQYLEPLKRPLGVYKNFQYGSCIKAFRDKEFPSLDGIQIALLGIGEARNSAGNAGCSEAPDKIREALYNLTCIEGIGVADLGNIIPGEKAKDSYHAVAFIVSKLLELNIVPVLLGGSQDLTYANYLGYEPRQQTVNLVCIDRTLDLGAEEEVINSGAYLNKIIRHEPNLLFNFSLLGYQTHFINPAEATLLINMYFDLYRLGQLQGNLEEAEPFVRNADILSFDISSVRRSDAPGTSHSTPNGLYGEEACQIFRYAGMSDKLSSVGIYEINPLSDNGNQTSELAAQLVWYFLEGFSNRKNDYPGASDKDYMKYTILIKGPDHDVIFYKSKKTGRWWMEVPFMTGKRTRYQRHSMVPCSYSDYQQACTGELPDRWWQAYQKLN